MGGPESDDDKLKDSNKISYANAAKVQQQTTPTPSTSPFSTTSSLAPSQQGKIDQTQWCIVEWFGCGDYWQNDFVKWIILTLEEKESSEQKSIDVGLETIKREINEIFGAGMIDSDSYNSCLGLITKCKNIRDLNFDKAKRNELLNIIFNNLQMEFEKAIVVIRTLEDMSVEQRSVLRFMTHQKIQARIAFLRTTLKSHKTTYDMEGYHCISNPYYIEEFKQKQAAITECNNLKGAINVVKASNAELSNKYNSLLAENDELLEKNSKLQEEIEAKDEQLLSQTEQSHRSIIRELIEKCTKMTQNDDKTKSEYEKQIKQLQELNSKMKSEYETQIKQLQERNGEMKTEYETQTKQLQERNGKMKTEYETQTKKLQESNGKMKSEYEAHMKRLQERNDKMKLDHEEYVNQLQEEAEELRKKAKSANDEASGYQAALGSVTNIRWSDGTFNNPIQLTKDIEKFQHSLADFTKVKGKSFKINEYAAKKLLAKYDCKADLDGKEIKNYLAAALQRMILETIFNIADNFYKHAEKLDTFTDGRLETFIVYFTQNLIEYTNLLTIHREGKDSITAITPIKIRQQIYAALGSRGFAKSNHPLMKKLANDILGKMEKYREVVDEKKKKDLFYEAEKIIRTGMQLWFCLEAQEPVPKIQWFKSGAGIEPHLMVGSWENENIKEIEVDFAFFPLIITEHDSQVFNKAQVFVRPKQNGKLQRLRDYLF